jgi:predicted GNAT superfamily acetyltransferase
MTGGMMAEIEIRDMNTLEDYLECVQLQKEVWGFDDPYDVVPAPLLMIGRRNDGVVLGAYEGNRMIGFVYSLPGTYHGKRVQWSHMLAVCEEYRNSDIGYRLKMEQYRISQKLNYEMIEWTYDPLESRNSHFNLKKLGCTAHEYEINVYGETSSPLHAGMPTDRLIAHWQIPPLEKSLPEWSQLPQQPDLITITKRVEDQLFIEDVRLDRTSQFLFLEIPEHIQSLKQKSREAALLWRLKTREAFLHYFGNGYEAYSFYRWTVTAPHRSFYVLKRHKA